MRGWAAGQASGACLTVYAVSAVYVCHARCALRRPIAGALSNPLAHILPGSAFKAVPTPVHVVLMPRLACACGVHEQHVHVILQAPCCSPQEKTLT